MPKCLHRLGVFLLNVIIVSRVQFVLSNLNVFIFNALIVLLVLLYSGINACDVTWRVSGGECHCFRVPAASPPGRLVTVVKPSRAWLLTLCCITTHLTSCKWWPPGQPFASTWQRGVSTCTGAVHACPTKIFYKSGAHRISRLTFG